MSYEPQTWATGDIITATKLNNIESGVQSVSSSYTPTTWVNGDIITAVKLNNIEQGIANAGGGSSDFSTATVTLKSTVEDQSTNSFPSVAEDFGGEDEIITEGYFGTIEEPVIVQAVLYQGSCKMSNFSPSVADASHLNIDGEATAQFGILGLQYITITGDCTITIS